VTVTFALADEVKVHCRQISDPELFFCPTFSSIEGLEVALAGPTAI
jgi:hypothetical protein